MKKALLRRQLETLAEKDQHRFHMPGHKGRVNQQIDVSLDVTEIDGADNLHAPAGILHKVQEKIAAIYASGYSFMLTGGSTAGNIASLMCVCKEGESILIPYNAHRSMYAGLSFGRINPIFYEPEKTPYGSYVTEKQVADLFKVYPESKGIAIVSPDYVGCLSELTEICKTVHQLGKEVIVDEAHGAHLKFTDQENAVDAKADFVIQSTHKMLSAMTQSSVLHILDRTNKTKIQKLLAMIESSSPSYLQMMSIEEAIDEASESAKEQFSFLEQAFEAFYDQQNEGDHFYLIEPSDHFDFGKWLFVSSDGFRDVKILEKHGIVPEMIHDHLILMMMGMHTSKEDLGALYEAYREINRIKDTRIILKNQKFYPLHQTLPILDTVRRNSEWIPIQESIGRISSGFVMSYPPGIPILIPGMRIDQNVVDHLEEAKKRSAQLSGMNENSIEVLVDEEN